MVVYCRIVLWYTKCFCVVIQGKLDQNNSKNTFISLFQPCKTNVHSENKTHFFLGCVPLPVTKVLWTDYCLHLHLCKPMIIK